MVPYHGRVLVRKVHTVEWVHARNLICEIGTAAMTQQPGTTESNLKHKASLCRQRKLRINLILWALDMTEICIEEGFLYPTAIGRL
jgi:hypothetical protein